MKNTSKHLLLILASLMPGAVMAQSVSGDTAVAILAGFVLVVAILVLIVASIVLQVLRTIVYREQVKKAETTGQEVPEKVSFWKRFIRTASDAVPVEREETVLLDHNYDGIQELDNHLPPWWKWLFYLSIAFGVVYLFVYHVFGVLPLSEGEYEQQIAEAEANQAERMANQPVAVIDESTVTYMEDETALAAGKQVYNNNCAQCHRDDGGGGIGPNLTDEYWLHGGSIQDIFTTIKQGVPEKGMISWEPLLSPEQMQNVASYVMSMGGSNPPNPKAPQGDVYRPADDTGQADSVQTVAMN